MDWSRLEEIRGYDSTGALVRKVVGSFVREGKSHIAAIERAAKERDGAALAPAAHALKGAALNVGATALAELCAALESWGWEGRVGSRRPKRCAARAALQGNGTASRERLGRSGTAYRHAFSKVANPQAKARYCGRRRQERHAKRK
jgi:hypothetical protein